MKKKRSVGVTVIGITMFLYAFWLLVGAITFNIGFYSKFMPSLFGSIFLSSSIELLIGLIYMVVSLGILGVKKWGRIIAVFLSVPLSLFVIYAIIVFIITFESWHDIFVRCSMNLLPALPALLFLIFLTRPKVKEQFR